MSQEKGSTVAAGGGGRGPGGWAGRLGSGGRWGERTTASCLGLAGVGLGLELGWRFWWEAE